MSTNFYNIGSVVKFKRKSSLYYHYGVLDGKGNVIHVHKRKGIITIDPLEKVSDYYSDIIVEEEPLSHRMVTYNNALSSVGKKHVYNIFTNNCENWVNSIRYKEDESMEQTDMIYLIVSAILTLSTVT